jgi:hypothetical protein
MSVWHETQVEYALDAADYFEENGGSYTLNPKIRQTLAKALGKASDLPEDDTEQALELLAQSVDLLTEAEKLLPEGTDRAIRIVRNRITGAKTALKEVADEIKADSA